MADPNPVARRRTFAIISHPDAGKTTLTEKMLLFGGAIQLAGEVRAKANRRQTRSDWMGIERERGISVVTSVMTFETAGCVFNLLDTPGHEDFSEDTYRTLTAVDSAVMVIDAAKGIEARTRKLFEVCRLRDIPIVTFINKMDRETRDPFDLLDEIEKTLALDAAPLNWTIGRGRSLAGAYDIRRSRLTPLGKDAETLAVNGPDDPRVAELLPEHERKEAIEELNLAVEGLKAFDKKAFLEGHMTPVLWGSALKDFGVKDLIDALAEFAPSPRAQEAASRTVKADEAENDRLRVQDPGQHGSQSSRPHRFPARLLGQASSAACGRSSCARGSRSRSRRRNSSSPRIARWPKRRSPATWSAFPIMGFCASATRLSEGEEIVFRGVPSFAPEILRRVKLADAMKAKKLREALQQMAEEGVVQVFLPHDGAAAIVGVVGALQLDVLDRAARRRIWPPGDLRAEPLRDLPLGLVFGQGRAREIRRRLSVLDRLRSRRRAGVHGVQRLQPALRAGALAEDRLHGREGLPEGGRMTRAVLRR